MLEFLKMINSDYAGILSLLASMIMVMVTIYYVVQTKRQADYAQQSANLAAQQIITDKQPCIVPTVVASFGSAFGTTNCTRIQLGFDIKLKNEGESCAINVYALAHFELQFTKDNMGNKKLLPASLLPSFVHVISSGEETLINIRFETKEIKELNTELERAMGMNWERLRTKPYQNPYVGARLIIHVFFRNIMGQWSETAVSYDVSWLEYKNPPSRNTNNINENTIPPMQIHAGDSFVARLVTDHFAPFRYKMITEEKVKNELLKYTNESPWMSEMLEKDEIMQ